MNIFKIFLILFLLISCSEKKTEKFVTEFDKILGSENSKVLSFLLSEFENDFLKRQYPDLNTDRAYQKFLTELSSGKEDDWKSISKKSKERFKSSNLRLEIYKFPDSVWVVNGNDSARKEDSPKTSNNHYSTYIKSRYKYNNPDGTFEYTYSEKYPMVPIKSNADFDSIIKSNMELPEFNYVGKYFKAIESIEENSDFFKEFYNWKSGMGIISPTLTAKMMLKFKVDLTNPLIKKIVILELVY